MTKFLHAYWRFVAIAMAMFTVASIFYLLAYEDPVQTQSQAGQIVKKFDDLYREGAGEEQKRQEVLMELLHEQRTEFYRLMLEHLAEALVLAGVMIVTAEGITRYMASKELLDNTEILSQKFREQADRVSENVWNAIFNRLVPEPIATEVKRIMKANVCRIRPQYTVVLSNEEYTNVQPGYVVVRRQLYYRLLNVTGGEVSYPLSIQTVNTTVGDIDLTAVDGSTVTLPRIREVQVRQSKVTLKVDQRTSFKETFLLPKMEAEGEAWEIYSDVEGLFLTTDRALYVLTAPCYGLEVQVENRAKKLLELQGKDIYLSSGSPLRLTTPEQWTYEGGLLPGTALSVPWRAV